ncbi:hypothetical protein SERLA73DRAFT_62286 [Serpula lacrymans var. lacrymans S7.3]|uniref:Cytochrome P450 n=2 Tax=Serpula lacrymans var. lacrymans TaxID=341189 RepID=F8QBL9_SERL3|nr:hypothetical protein SERLA73DRAFT_62286 [Serpula lacrymans var. lacrymans S7.3]
MLGVALLLGVVTVVRTALHVIATRRLPLPPGPPGHWLFGNTFPTSYAPHQFARWTEEYGPVFSLRRGTQVYVIIGRHQAAVDIMEKEGASLADRPRSVSAGETLSGGMRVLTVRFGPTLKKLRRVLHALLQEKSSATYQPIQLENAKRLVIDILNDPKQHQMHAKRYAASVIMSITYGKTTPTAYTDPEVTQVNKCLGRLGSVIRPGTYLIDTYPIMRYIPGYLSELKIWHQEELALFRGQIDIVRKQMENEEARPSFAKYLLEHQQDYDLSDNELAYVAGSMFGAGSDTTASAISIMIMAAAVHPEMQALVHDELEKVIGRERAPTFDDQSMLPMVTAFMLESFRWRPVSIGGFAHCTTKDIVWNGYCIPTGAIVIGNHWAIANDPEVFTDPEKFNPRRWLGDDGQLREDLKFFTFGFGRRACPGQPVANRSVFINTALILWAFRISQNPSYPIDTHAFSDTANTHAAPFQVIFEKRMSEDEIYGNLQDI